MGVCELWFVLLLLLHVYINCKETHVQTTGREAYITPVCSNDTMKLTLIFCKIRSERIKGNCSLIYTLERSFENKCDSRFKLMMQNQTVFLHLSSLTPADSGNYSCECSYPGETSDFHLNLTVEGKCWIYFFNIFLYSSDCS
ncbi:hypothetical protein PAMA_014475 [Pampus argenteus]